MCQPPRERDQHGTGRETNRPGDDQRRHGHVFPLGHSEMGHTDKGCRPHPKPPDRKRRPWDERKPHAVAQPALDGHDAFH
ncbi:MAG: hypothetical protein R3C10_19745 [Pirellulales bacterium]